MAVPGPFPEQLELVLSLYLLLPLGQQCLPSLSFDRIQIILLACNLEFQTPALIDNGLYFALQIAVRSGYPFRIDEFDQLLHLLLDLDLLIVQFIAVFLQSKVEMRDLLPLVPQQPVLLVLVCDDFSQQVDLLSHLLQIALIFQNVLSGSLLALDSAGQRNDLALLHGHRTI